MANGSDPGYYREVSLHLARALDDIGLNKLTVKKRRHGYLFREQLDNVLFRLTGENYTNYQFGSQTEGATTPGMNSDVDTLMCFHGFNVIEDWVDWKQGPTNLLMLHEDTVPGYCRLQLLRDDVPMARDNLPDAEYTYDRNGRVIVKNTWIHSIASKAVALHDRNGPAASQNTGPGALDNDIVVALPCRTWPGQAEAFIKRRRRHGWPSQRLLEEATSHGVFLVPVGYKLSRTEPLEWRISASMAERCLMFSLNIVHIKCYVVLKMLAKTFIEPVIQKCISSYHCKTALLNCTETTEPGFWREENLLKCVTRCLEILRNWVSELFCPQFMIREENLFAGKVTVHNRALLKSILTELIRSDGRALLQVKMDSLGHKLQTMLNTEPSCVTVVDSTASVMLVGQFEHDKQENINAVNKEYLLEVIQEKQQMSLMLRSVYQNICTVNEQVGRAHKHKRHAIQTFIEILSCLFGSLLASFSLAHNKRIPHQAIQLMSTTATYDFASMLKLASVFYCNGKFSKVEAILNKGEDLFCLDDMLPMCWCYDKPTDKPIKLLHEFCQMMHALRGKKRRTKLFAHCVRFSRHEMHSAPPALRYEMHRSVGDDTQHSDPSDDDWMVLAVVDCLPYFYYLQYITYKNLRKLDIQRRSLRNLDRCVREDHDFSHLETAWNLLGQCWEDEQDPNAAMACYRTSLEIRRRNNAANWHMAILLYILIRDRGLLPRVAGDQPCVQ